MKELTELVEALAGHGMKLIQTRRSPWETYQELTAPELTHDEHVRRALSLWVTLSLLCAALLFPLLALVGIPWNSVPFHLSNLLADLLFLLIAVTFVHYVLKLFKVSSLFDRTLAAFTVIWTPYLLFLILLNFPIKVSRYLELQAVKAKSPADGLMEAILKTLPDVPGSGPQIYQVYAGIFTPLQILASFALWALTARALAIIYRAPLRRTVDAVGFACVTGMVVIAPCYSLVNRFIVYATLPSP